MGVAHGDAQDTAQMLYSKRMARTQKLALIISILASFVAFLDGSVVNVALPAINRELGGGLATQQWVVDAYLITLGALMLLAGSLSDLYGRKRIMLYGLVGFGATSLLCAIAPTAEILIGARALQGVAGALLVPSSLALIIATFSGKDQGKAIGAWTAWTGISFIVGPVLGGFLVDTASWRLVFAINVLPVLLCLMLLARLKVAKQHVSTRLDIPGALLCSAGLSGMVFGLIEQPHYGWSHPLVFVPALGGALLTAAFIWYERRAKNPMLPLELFSVNNFRYGNIATFGIYGGLSIATFLLAIYLQQVVGYSALMAGLALLPVTLIMFFMSSRFGALAGRYGPRFFMTVGPLLASLSFLFFAFLPNDPNYWIHILPGVMLFGIGLSATVAPLTSAVLGEISPKKAGIASAVNNAVARIAGLLAIALIGIVTGPQLESESFQRAMLVTALLVASGGVISWIGIRNKIIESSDALDVNR